MSIAFPATVPALTPLTRRFMQSPLICDAPPGAATIRPLQSGRAKDITAFLSDLELLSASGDARRVATGFLADLETVHRAMRPSQRASHDFVLTELGRVLEQARATVTTRLGGSRWLENIAAHDPLRCPVGLLTSLDLGLRETAHTGALAWLMNPSAEHGFKSALVAAFVRVIYELDFDPELIDIDIASEHLTIDHRGRIDVVIRGAYRGARPGVTHRFRVIIEAKVNADEGDKQCARYERHVRETTVPGEQQRFVFLTRDGREPATIGRHGPKKWIQLSFLRLMALYRRSLNALQDRPGFPLPSALHGRCAQGSLRNPLRRT